MSIPEGNMNSTHTSNDFGIVLTASCGFNLCALFKEILSDFNLLNADKDMDKSKGNLTHEKV